MRQIHNEISHFVASMNKQLGVGPSTITNKCITGDPVVTLSVGIKPEGIDPPVSDTIEKAWYRFQGGFKEYARGKSGPIYWRQEPRVMRLHDGYWIRARLFIASRHTREDSYQDSLRASIPIPNSDLQPYFTEGEKCIWWGRPVIEQTREELIGFIGYLDDELTRQSRKIAD